MGYTHYYESVGPYADNDWAAFIGDVATIVRHVAGEGVPLANGLGDEGSLPQIGPTVVFNGSGDEAYETFSLDKTRGGFGFCKTAHKPYDLAVCMVLIMAKRRFGGGIDVSSDGDASDWTPAMVAIEDIFGVQSSFVDNKLKVS